VRESVFGKAAWAPLAAAWRAYFYDGDREATLAVHLDEGPPESMPVSLFFRTRDELRPVDVEALARVRGRALDGGAGVGATALILQEDGIQVTAVEAVPEGAAIMEDRGVEDARAVRLEDLRGRERFDTILLLMNGSALAGTLAGLPTFLGTLEDLLAPGGQVLMDSTDLLEVADEATLGATPHGREESDPDASYPGDLQYQLEFRGVRGAPFPQLFVDPGTLARTAAMEGWRAEVVWRGPDREYLARLTRAATF